MKLRRLAAAASLASAPAEGSSIVVMSASVMRDLLPLAPAQMVLRGIVGDAKQPLLGTLDRGVAVERLQRLQHRLLHDVLAVDHRAGHAGAVAMQLRAQSGEHRLQCRAVEFLLCSSVLVLCVAGPDAIPAPVVRPA